MCFYVGVCVCVCTYVRGLQCSYKYPWIFLFKCTYFYHFPNHRFMCMPINFKLFAPSEPPSNKKQPLNAIKNYFLISFQFHKLPKSDGTHTVACSVCLFFSSSSSSFRQTCFITFALFTLKNCIGPQSSSSNK